jgi:hypothetical protein
LNNPSTQHLALIYLPVRAQLGLKHNALATQASTQASTLEEFFGQNARVLSLALRAADRRSRTHAAQLSQGVRQGASGAGPATMAL